MGLRSDMRSRSCFSVVQKKRARLARHEMLPELPADRLSAREFYLFEGGLRYPRSSPKAFLDVFWLHFTVNTNSILWRPIYVSRIHAFGGACPPRQPIPLAAVKVSAEFPLPAADYEDRRPDLNECLIRNLRPLPRFFVPMGNLKQRQ